ncbi:MAG: DUF1838 domain-containing protein [Gammaproteobacteria bacterium]|nr:DUF1838 domain-containing protein [Gammaproteobacteria bacterium]
MLNRRTMIQYALIAGYPYLLSGLPAKAANSDLTGPDLADPEQLLTAYMRLAGSLDDRLVIWWMEGIRYGVVDARATALYGMKVGMFQRYFKQPDGSFKQAMFELTYYTDLATGELLETYENPYTSEQNKVRHVRLGPEIRHQTSSGISRPDNPMVKQYNSSLGPALIRGDHIWIPIDVEATIQFPKPSAPTILINHYTTAHGKLSDALNGEIASAPCELNFQNVIKWEPWMKMGGHSGHMMSRAAGRKLESIEELPADYRQMAERQHGKYMSDPIKTLEKLAKKIQAS